LSFSIVTIETIHFRNATADINMTALLTVKGMLMSHVQVVDALPEWRESAPYWAKHHATIRQMFAPLTRALVEDAGIIQGQAVLDIAGGAGEPSLTIAEIVGPTGTVTCTDAVAEMVEAARTEARDRGLTNVQFRQCTADDLPFPDNSFDVTISRLGAMFFPDPELAFREMLRVTKPGGSLGFVVWHKSEFNPYSYLVTEVLSRHIEIPPSDPDAPNAFRFAEPGKLTRVLRSAGASNIRERIFEFDSTAPISPEEFWDMRSEISEMLRDNLQKFSTAERWQIGKQVQHAVREYFPNNQMRFPSQAIIVTGKK
jgi:ubiquinone/menaquinone biosynthesis C-methylase UbiE